MVLAWSWCLCLWQGCRVDATPSLGLSPPPYFTSNKSTADIKSPCSRRAGIISFVNTRVFMDICFLHHFKWQMKTRHTTNVHNFSPTIFTEKSIGNRIRGFFSQLFLQRDEPNTMTPNTHIHTHRPTVKCKQKILLLVIVFHNHFVIIQNNAYLNPDWEESHWLSSTRCLKQLNGWARGGSV